MKVRILFSFVRKDLNNNEYFKIYCPGNIIG